MSSQRNGGEYIAKIRSNVWDWRAWFVYDPRTRSIRLAHKPQFALANMQGVGFKKGYNAVFRSYANERSKETFTVFSKRNILNLGLQCLTPSSYRTDEGNTVIWWKCNDHKTQQWQRGVKVPFDKFFGDHSKKRFQLELNMDGNRKIYLSKARNGSEHIAKIHKSENTWRSWFVYDVRTKSIRLEHNRNFALSNERFLGMKTGGLAVFRNFVHGADQHV